MARKRGGLAGFYDRNRGAVQAATPLLGAMGIAGLRRMFSGGQEPEMGIPSLPPSPYGQGTGEAPMAEMAETVPLPDTRVPMQLDPSRLQMSAIAQQQAAKAATPPSAPRPRSAPAAAPSAPSAPSAPPRPSMGRMAAGMEPGMDGPPPAPPRPTMSGQQRRQGSQMLGAMPGLTGSPDQFQTMTRDFTGPALTGEPYQALGQGGNPQAEMASQMAPGLIDYLMASNPQLFGRAGASTLNRQRGFRR